MTLKTAKFIHCIGIGGIGLSAIAQILHEQGKKISGSDLVPSDITNTMQKSGIKIYHTHQAKNLHKSSQLVIYSPAIPKDNPELKEAKKLKIKCISYPEALGQLTQNYFTIAISGTHGKSTTTAMIALMLTQAKLDPIVVVGTKLKEFDNKNYRLGKSNFLVIEACEYKRSFLHFEPNILVITNIEADHLDYYKDLNDYIKAFNQLAEKVPQNGAIIINGKDKNSQKIFQNSKIKARKIAWNKVVNHKLKIPGQFNLQNATFAKEVGILLNIPKTIIKQSLEKYTGAWRRLEYKKTKLKKTIFIDDYAHHPTEITATLKAIRQKYPNKKILCVYQPHQHNRTKHFLKGFAKSFKNVDAVIIPDIYKVRDTEKDSKKISTDLLVKAIQKHHPNVQNGHGLEKTADYLKKSHQNYDLIVTMGAGDIGDIYKMI